MQRAVMNNDWFLDATAGLAGTNYLALYGERLSAQRTEREVNAVLRLVSYSQHTRFLDAPCGYGRHAVALSARGFDVTGVDIHPDLTAYAAQRQASLQLDTLRFYTADLRHWRDAAAYDVIFNLHTGFGYFDTDNDDRRIIKNFRQSLRPGGELVIEYLNSKRLKGLHAGADNALTAANGTTSTISPDGCRYLVTHFRDTKQMSFSLRLYSREELEALLQENHFAIQGVYGDYLLRSYTGAASSRVIIHAKAV